MGAMFHNHYSKKSSYSQHFRACSIAKLLGEKFPQPVNSTKPLEIVACDGLYTKADLHSLAQLPKPMTVVSDLHYYLTIIPESLVICIGRSSYAPMFEIVADMLYPTGPTVWLCRRRQGME
jgi:hypothetical protein